MVMQMYCNRRRICPKSYTVDYYANRAKLRALVYSSDTSCFNQLRMYGGTFDRLCGMLETIGGLKPTKNMLVDEQVAIFVHIAHHVKNRVIQFQFGRSGETISRHFHMQLNAMMHLEETLLKTPEPVPDDSTDERWKWFKGCLGALDGTHIKMTVPAKDQPRYRNRKGEIITNVLGVCTRDGQFVYVLSGWKGFAADGLVLRNAILRPNGLKVPQGQYYLVDVGFTNSRGFLAPYRGQRYHLSEWREGRHPTNPQECFNMRHSSARNVIECCFGMLRKRWAILRSPSFYHVKTHNKIIIGCCLLHNLIRQDTTLDQLEDAHTGNEDAHTGDEDAYTEDDDFISTIETSDEWSGMRDGLAVDMFNAFRGQTRRSR
ncbi:protein ALP1-like [Senna tora]|uniref:Protein ALP1-like n=1 Tax=Senna tora TaxID=362788 RepID=A0A834SRR8_9FABA|nr:protein ALP1-like [Senna tora]